mmetsp:Transcript_56037/g.149502  ORF Transcript_56037/g.149502 Transcript_56037/m.149502 type:complete len:107 (-) Transcript_56037:64-384(-)
MVVVAAVCCHLALAETHSEACCVGNRHVGMVEVVAVCCPPSLAETRSEECRMGNRRSEACRVESQVWEATERLQSCLAEHRVEGIPVAVAESHLVEERRLKHKFRL